MGPDESATTVSELTQAALHIRNSGILGRSGVLNQIFDFLLERSIEDSPPKEVEIAVRVFGRPFPTDGSQDTSVRVYIHRLRRKLAEHYADAGAAELLRLTIPKGEYRFVVEQVEAAVAAPDTRARATYALIRRVVIAGMAAILVILALNIGAWISVAGGSTFWAARRTAVWAPLFKNNRPILIVVGDYYIFGEQHDFEVSRLIREFSVNSPEDLDKFVMAHPEHSEYTDLDLRYIPVGVTYAVARILPYIIHSDADRKRVLYTLSSDLTPEMIKRSNIVYMGYFSGLGTLRGPVLAGSRFSLGSTYDELIDSRTENRYVSQAGGPVGSDAPNRDYGYFSTFSTPSGGRVVIMAGTRDIASMQIAIEAITKKSVDAARKAAGGADDFEALYEVQGIGRSNLSGKLILASPLQSNRIWSQSVMPAPSLVQ